jgi:hypothetical protein
MTEVYRQIIDHPSAWTGRSLGGKAAIVTPLTSGQLDAFDELLRRTRHLAPQAVTRKDFDHPALNPLLDDLFEEIQHGRGAVIVAGMTRERYSDEDMERVYWGFGTHWGIAATQSALGDKLGRVSKTPVGPGNAAARGYKSDEELKPHTDSFEIVGLLCVQKAPVGGESQIVSSLAIHNEILKTRPEMLEPLYRGFPYGTSEAAKTDTPLTPGVVPVFACLNGMVSSRFVRAHMRRAAEAIGVAMPKDLDAALDYYAALSTRADLQLAFTLEAGEMLFFNNFVTLHARSEFKDGETQKRQLLRLWLDVPNGRPAIPAYDWQAQAYKKVGASAKAVAQAVG